MAGASMNDIKARMKSVSSTMQITKAMELVATSKLRKAKERVERSRPFADALKDAIESIAALCSESDGGVFAKVASGKTLFIVIAGDRGLAGGYNANVFRTVAGLAEGKDAIYLPIGKKAVEYYRHKDASIFTQYDFVADMGVGAALKLGREVQDGFVAGEFTEVVLVYTEFVSMISQVPRVCSLLPLTVSGDGVNDSDPIIGGDPEEMLESVVASYIGGNINSAVLEALASESGARRTAMNAANKNASEMIDSLTLSYNRARQAMITQEITEIVSGAEAL